MSAAEKPATLPALFSAMAARRRRHDAVVTVGETVSYQELEQRSARMALALLAAGAGKGSRVALMAPDGVYWVTAFLAAQRIGALVTLVSTLATPPELGYILRHSDAQFLLGTRRFLKHDYAENLLAAAPSLAAGRAGALRLPEMPYLRAIWLDDAQGLEWAESVEALLARVDAPGAPDRALLAAIEDEVSPGEDAVIVYTSGSTAMPKAVVHSQGTLTRQPVELAKLIQLVETDRLMPLLPAFWMGGLGLALEVLSVGATLVYPPAPDTATVLDAVQALDVNRLIVWHMMAKLRAEATARGIDIDTIQGLGPHRDAAGNLIPPELVPNLLGMSESFAAHSGEVIYVPLAPDKAGASGRAVNGIERRIVDPDTGVEVAPGEVGELQLRGGALMTGLYKVAKEKVFTADGFFPTSDLARIDADGYLWFTGRTGDMIKTNSANVSRLEVEAALYGVPGVDLPIVVGLADAEIGQLLVAAIVPAKGASLSEEGVREALRTSLSSYKVPRRVIFIGHDEVPRTSTGKLKLSDLAAFVAERLEVA